MIFSNYKLYLNMKKIFFVLAILTTATIYSQDFYIPYKVGSKFGISDEKGNIKLKPQFDILEYVYNQTDLLVGFNFVRNEVLSSVIYKNKVILANQKYKSYYLDGGLLKAIEYNNPNYDPVYFSADREEIEESNMLYTLNGKQIFAEPLPYISVFTEWEMIETMEDLLIHTLNKNKKSSLYLFNKKSEKITKAYYEEVEEITFNGDYASSLGQIWITYKTKDGKGKKINFTKTGNTITSEVEDYHISVRNEYGYSDGFPMPTHSDVVDMKYPTVKKTDEKLTTWEIIESIRTIAPTTDYYWKPKKIDEIKFGTRKLVKSYSYIAKENGKYGYHYTVNKKDTLRIPIKYDEILYGDGGSGTIGSAFIVRKNKKYGLSIWDKPIIEPIFDYLPLLEKSNFVKEDFHLIRLYDKDNKFFCYANQDGKLYYSKK